MASITSVGVGSGIDLEALLDQIIAAERDPVENQLSLRAAEIEASISALGGLSSTMAGFQDALTNLKNADFFTQRRTIGDSTKFTSTATADAAFGNYSIEFFDLASANKVATNAQFASPAATAGEGTITIGFEGGLSFDVDVAATDSLTTIRDAINNASNNIGVTANLITVDAGMGDGSTVTELVLSSNDTGASRQLTISVNDTGDGNNTDNLGLSRFFYDGADPDNSINGLNQLRQIDAAQDARISVDGFTVFSDTNTFDNVIEGVSITALVAADDPLDPPSAVLNISADKSAATAAVETFVASYNELVTVFNVLTNFDQTTETRGLLSGDASVNAMESTLRRIVGNTVTGAESDFNALTFLGISTNRDGSLSLDSDKLATAIDTHYDDFASLFSGTSGIATQLDDAIDSFLSSSGVFKVRDDTYRTQLRQIDERRDNLELRLTNIENRFRQQFSALDQLVSSLNQTGDFLLQQLDAAARIVNRDNGGS